MKVSEFWLQFQIQKDFVATRNSVFFNTNTSKNIFNNRPNYIGKHIVGMEFVVKIYLSINVYNNMAGVCAVIRVEEAWLA